MVIIPLNLVCSHPEMQEQVGLLASSDQAQTLMRDGMRGMHNGRNCICPNFLISLLLLYYRSIAVLGSTVEGAATWLAKQIFK